MTIYRKQPDGSYEAQPVAATRAELPAQPSPDGASRATPVYLTRSPAPARAAGDRNPLGLIPVFRAVQVMQTAALQLPLVVQRQGVQLTGEAVPRLIRRPSLEMDRSDFIGQAVMSLMTTGELFIYRHRVGNEIVDLRIVDPTMVQVSRDDRTRVITYHHDGRKFSAEDFDHQTLMRGVNTLRGFGPIQAARTELGFATDLREYAGNWFNGAGHPNAILKSDQPLTAADAQQWRDDWNHYDRDTGQFRDRDNSNPAGIRVLGKGLSYTPLFLNPKDAQWLEVRKFTVTDVARLFGVPSSLMLVSLDGNSLTYSNVEQEWLAFVRFTLIAYLRKIEETLTKLAPAGQTVRFNLDALLRSDTLTRYQAHEIGIRAGWLDPDEARAHEDLPPLTEAQRDRITTANQSSRTRKDTAL
ncbi:phage portal protein [Kocuria sp.]|uniref:phage portal protein n=1 Tax=Kocuria sp. TaxID=1871328 RepID=UPI0026E0F422|nr:phage portal protein [Kocuria sp.]MDO5618026.1 phage portal protein [Kocuria sp.]